MGSAELKKSFKDRKAVLFIERALSSYFFPAVSAGVVIACYFLGLDVVALLYLCLCTAAILIFCKNLTPIIFTFLLFNVFSSVKNSAFGPGGINVEYFSWPIIFIPAIAGAAVLLAAAVARLVITFRSHSFKLTHVFYGVFVFAASLLVNGLMNPQYALANAVFGVASAVTLTLVFVLLSGGFKAEKDTFIKISYYFIIFFAMLLVELIVHFSTVESAVYNGAAVRGNMYFGWGAYDEMGTLLTLTVPAWFYLAGKYKYGMPFLLGALLNVVAAFFSMSIGAAFASVAVFAFGIVWLFVWRKRTYRVALVCAIIGGLTVTLITLSILDSFLWVFFTDFSTSLAQADGLIPLWKHAIRSFLDHPLTGVGLYDPAAAYGHAGHFTGNMFTVLPQSCRNVFVQLLCTGGAVAFVAYAVHGAQTATSYFKNVTAERTLAAIIILAMLIAGLADSCLNRLPTLAVWAAFVAILSVSEKDKKDNKNKGKKGD